MQNTTIYDVIIIGGSYAGLSAAMALGRSLRRVLVLDSGNPCNQQTPHSHNFLTQDGKTPKEISALAKAQVERYDTVEFAQGFASKAQQVDDNFKVSLDDGRSFQSRKLVLATGIKDLLPDIKGFAACWGISVIHCPYCHGYEFKGQPTGILADSEKATHLSGLVRNLTPDLTLFEPETEAFTTRQQERVADDHVKLVHAKISEILHDKGYMRAVRLDNDTEIPLKAIYAAIPFEQHSAIPQDLGCALTETGLIEVDAHQKTSIPGVYACGDNSAGMRSIASSIYTGNLTGAVVNMELTIQA